jgi:hypothetical protein
MYTCIHICIYVQMYISCTYVYTERERDRERGRETYQQICMYKCVCIICTNTHRHTQLVYMHTLCTYINIHIIHTHTQTDTELPAHARTHTHTRRGLRRCPVPWDGWWVGVGVFVWVRAGGLVGFAVGHKYTDHTLGLPQADANDTAAVRKPGGCSAPQPAPRLQRALRARRHSARVRARRRLPPLRGVEADGTWRLRRLPPACPPRAARGLLPAIQSSMSSSSSISITCARVRDVARVRPPTRRDRWPGSSRHDEGGRAGGSTVGAARPATHLVRIA